jgi:hypothetical protein
MGGQLEHSATVARPGWRSNPERQFRW